MAGARRTLCILGAALAAVLWAGAARAQTCVGVSTTPVAFGDYDTRAAGALDGQGSVTVTCDLSVPYDIQIGASGTSGAFTPRQMALAGKPLRLEYNLYTDGSYAQVWGDGAQGNGTGVKHGVGTGAQQSYTIFGRIPPLQVVSVGNNYMDTLTVTLLW